MRDPSDRETVPDAADLKRSYRDSVKPRFKRINAPRNTMAHDPKKQKAQRLARKANRK